VRDVEPPPGAAPEGRTRSGPLGAVAVGGSVRDVDTSKDDLTDRAPAPAPAASTPASPAPEFGPGGYLPDRAARRARKIVLRAPLGLQWVVASLVAGLVVLIAGVLLLGRGAAPPGAPWEPLGPVQELSAASIDVGSGLLIVSVGDRVRAFEAPPGVTYCAASNRLEHPDGRVWALTGRGYALTASLTPVPTLTVAGDAYLDPTTRGAPLEPLPDAAQPGC
jgi:hypothetical protein